MPKDLPTICSGCCRINIDGQWVDADSFSDYYTVRRKLEDIGKYCPECTEHFKKEKSEFKKMYQVLRN